MAVIVLGKLHILIWFQAWLDDWQDGKPFANLADITSIACLSDVYGIYMHVWQILVTEWIILHVMAHTMKKAVKTLVSLRIDSAVLNNKPCAFSYFSNCRQLYLLFCSHLPKHMQFTSINKKFKSDVNKKLIERQKSNSRN